jgi:protein-arginine kinase activator protein McsA
MRYTKSLEHKRLREFAYARSGGLCWFCGEPTRRPRYTPDGKVAYDAAEMYALEMLDKSAPRTEQNAALACRSCSATYANVDTLEELRLAKMRQTISDGISVREIDNVSQHGGKVRLKYLHFYFERPEFPANLAR